MTDQGTLALSPTMRALTDLSSDSIFLLDSQHRITYINRTAEGLAIEDAIGTVIFDLLTEEQATVARAAFQRATQTGEKTSYEITFPLPDGRLSRWATHIGPQQDGSFVVVSSDVTEQASAQEELNLLFALSQDLLFMTRYDGTFLRVNPAAVSALGHSLEELTTQPFLGFVHPEDRARTKEAFRRMIEESSDLAMFENRYVTKSGDYRLLQWTARPDPASRRVVAVARDITESRAMEQRLHQSQKMEAVGQLAGGIAHDFNNLLQSILGAVDCAADATPGPEVAEQLRDIETAAERAAELVRRLLSFSRHRPFSNATVEVSELIDEPIKLLRRVLPATIEVHVIKGQGSHPVMADRAQLEQALLNLCLNARDAMPAGGLLTVEVEDIEVRGDNSTRIYGVEAGDYVALTVTDEGTGMTDEVRERMFEPFFTTKPMGRGTGLGMSMVYGTVTRHGGTVHVDSRPNRGTRVQLLLPLAEASEPPTQTDASVSVEPATGHECILVAEDEPQVRRLCTKALERAGYRVLAAADGAEAIELARTHDHIDLALFDVVMPAMTGPQAYAAIRKIHPELPVIFSSGYADMSHLDAVGPGDAPVLTKPLRMNDLLAAVREALNGHRLPPR